jgi:Rod binding domain-containing protein
MSISNISGTTGHMELAKSAVENSDLEALNKDFEALLVREVVKSMRKTIQKSGLFSSDTGQAMGDYLIENALSESLAKGRVLGIDRVLAQSQSE